MPFKRSDGPKILFICVSKIDDERNHTIEFDDNVSNLRNESTAGSRHGWHLDSWGWLIEQRAKYTWFL